MTAFGNWAIPALDVEIRGEPVFSDRHVDAAFKLLPGDLPRFLIVEYRRHLGASYRHEHWPSTISLETSVLRARRDK